MHEIITLPNKLRVVIENIPHVKSVTFGIWVGVGSCRETRANSGISHFIEHMLFKGTKKRSARQIARTIDDIGGQINAFTGRDCTCYYAKVLSDHLDIAADMLSDMLFNSLFDNNDMALEKSVILEEINMCEDTPEELVHDLLAEKSWKGNALGYSILGSKKSLKRITRKEILDFMGDNYTPENSVIAVVGNFDRQSLIEMINEKFGAWKANKKGLKPLSAPRFCAGRYETLKDIEQAHLCIGYNSIPRGHELQYALMVVNTILGNGMSSRLFQKIREEKGLVYSIYSYQSVYAKAGLFTIYAGMNPARVEEVTELIFKEIEIMRKDSVSEDELQKCKEQLKGNLILGLESTSSRMNSFGQSLLFTNRIKTIDEVIENINSVNRDKINSAIEMVFNSPSIAIVQSNGRSR
ncbi:MAG: Protease 3 precursor [Firmicutes bacterium ADurb.Bin193]|nr:MAG: Protease 3 precursor [Firmicutes bacterium ADurb.Bin193]